MVHSFIPTALFLHNSCSIVVSITGCTHGDLRLAGFGLAAEGRVEVCVDGVWGTGVTLPVVLIRPKLRSFVGSWDIPLQVNIISLNDDSIDIYIYIVLILYGHVYILLLLLIL